MLAGGKRGHLAEPPHGGRREQPRAVLRGQTRRAGDWLKRSGLWAPGPRIVIITLVCYLAMQVLAAFVPLLYIGERPSGVAALGWTLVVVAFVLWLLVGRQVRAAHSQGRLVTDGIFGYVRDPIHAVFIFLVTPGMALLMWSWPGLALPAIAYGLYRRFIAEEEARLAEAFGPQYEVYRRRVPALVPRLRR